MAKALIITEKPSVARDIAAALGGATDHDGYFENDDYVITFAVGHLLELLEPEEVDEKYKRWVLDVLPILPERFQLKKKKGQSDRIRTIQKLAERDDVDRIVNACDAGREGELIFRELAQFLDFKKPIQRLWLQSMTKTSIQRGFNELIPGSQMEGLGQAAECRAWTDWLIGMNATRAITKRMASKKEKTAWSAGRVQTPTLALLVARELEVLAHVPRPYFQVKATFEHEGEAYEATWFDPNFKATEDEDRRDDRIFDEARANAVVAAVSGQAGEASETRKPSKESAPTLFDLTTLQREANRRFGWSARRTLGGAQRLYEGHKLLTYPRTDSKCLPEDYRQNVDDVLAAFAGATDAGSEFAPHARKLQEDGLLNDGKIFNDAGVSDHFAIVPTGNLPATELSGDDKRLYDFVVRRFLGAFYPPATWERVERTTEVAGESFRTRARTLREPGWRAVLPGGDDETQERLPALAPGQDDVGGVAIAAREATAEAEETKPPPRLSEARLLGLMENAGKTVDDDDAAEALDERGLGTPATRADIIENLILKSYAVRLGKALRPTVKGIRLIDTLRRINVDRLSSAKLTGEIERHLSEVEEGKRTADDFMQEIKDYACEIVERTSSFDYVDLYKDEEPLGPCPACGRPVIEYVWFYRCEEDPNRPEDVEDCPMRFWKDTSGRYIDRNSITALLKTGKTPILDGFTARNGRTYKGEMEVDTDEWKLKVRSAGWNEEGENALAEYEVDTTPLGRCPFNEDCEIIETPTHFTCPKRLKEEQLTLAHRAAKRLAKEKGEPPPEKPEKPENCGFVMPRTVCKREITRDEALYYLANGKTELLTDFTSRFGRPFSATLVLKETGRHGFEFPPRGKKAKDGEGEADASGDAAKTPRKKAATKKATRKKAATKKVAAKKTTRKKAASKKAAAKKTTRKKATTKKASARKKVASKAVRGAADAPETTGEDRSD